MIEKLKKLWKFVETCDGLWLFIRIGFWLALVSILLRLIPLPSILKLLTPKKPSKKKWQKDKLVNFISLWLGQDRAFFRRSCLKRSLVLYRYLNLQKEPARFFIGIKKEDDKILGHAWIMLGEQKLFPDENINYKIIYTYPQIEKDSRKITPREISKIMD